MHLDDELIQRLVHGELVTEDEAVAARHLAGCAGCRLRVAEAEREERQIFELLHRIDHPMPDVAADDIAERAREDAWTDTASSTSDPASAVASITSSNGTVSRRPASRSRGVPRWSGGTTRWVRWAAGIIFLLAAASVAYAVPNSPVRAWVSRMVGLGNGATSRPQRSAGATRSATGSAGIAVAPSDRFLIRFITTQKRGAATVSLTNGSEITISALDGAAAFTSDIDRLTIDNAGSETSYEIHLPRGARWVEILVAGRRVLLKRGDRVVTSAGADSGGYYVLPLTSAASR
jgi:hypothetical protein